MIIYSNKLFSNLKNDVKTISKQTSIAIKSIKIVIRNKINIVPKSGCDKSKIAPIENQIKGIKNILISRILFLLISIYAQSQTI